MYREATMWHYRESTPCAVSKDKWDTKEDAGKVHEAGIVCNAVCQKTPVRLKQCRIVKKNQACIALAVIDV